MQASENSVIVEGYLLFTQDGEEVYYHNNEDSVLLEFYVDDSDMLSASGSCESVQEFVLYCSDDEVKGCDLAAASLTELSVKREESTCDPCEETLKTLELQVQEEVISFENVSFDFIDTFKNVANNYDNYVQSSIKSTLAFKDLDFEREVSRRLVQLPPTNKKHTLVIDLDETLIHANFETEFNPTSHSCETAITSFYDSDILSDVRVNVFKRPGVVQFLEKMSKDFQLVLFTASVQDYADAVISVIDPENKFFDLRLYRENCIKIGRAYIKDLRIFKGRDLENIIILDNSLYSFANQLSNGILINSFYDDPRDAELANIGSYLTDYLAKANDVTFVNDQVFGFKSLYEEERRIVNALR
jgi:CTD small phosphatase-like protein 2